MSKNKRQEKEEEVNKTIEKLKTTSMFQFDPMIPHQHIVPEATYAPWENDQTFKSIYERIKNNTLVDIYRCYELWDMSKSVRNMDGDVLEVGVWQGGTGALLCKAAEADNSTVFLADTFKGVVKASENDTVYRGGEHSDTSVEIVKKLLNEVNVNNYQILKGIFPDDFPELKLSKIKLCHIDVDTFQSSKDIFEYIWPKVEVGGIVVFDDYGFWTCEGVTKYFNSLNLTDGRKIHNLNGHGIIIKF